METGSRAMGRLARWERGSSGGCWRRTTRAKTTSKVRATEDASSREGFSMPRKESMDAVGKMKSQEKTDHRRWTRCDAGRLTGGTPRCGDTNPGDAQSACRVRERAAQARRAVIGCCRCACAPVARGGTNDLAQRKRGGLALQGKAQVQAYGVS
jgi:hypothetical protein